MAPPRAAHLRWASVLLLCSLTSPARAVSTDCKLLEDVVVTGGCKTFRMLGAVDSDTYGTNSSNFRAAGMAARLVAKGMGSPDAFDDPSKDPTGLTSPGITIVTRRNNRCSSW